MVTLILVFCVVVAAGVAAVTCVGAAPVCLGVMMVFSALGLAVHAASGLGKTTLIALGLTALLLLKLAWEVATVGAVVLLALGVVWIVAERMRRRQEARRAGTAAPSRSAGAPEPDAFADAGLSPLHERIEKRMQRLNQILQASAPARGDR